jgi:hypothetical protein
MLYLNIKQIAPKLVSGEVNLFGYGWHPFKGDTSLMKIIAVLLARTHHCMIAANLIWRVQDGHGVGLCQGDWTGIRDSVPETLDKLEKIADEAWRLDSPYGTKTKWPWEQRSSFAPVLEKPQLRSNLRLAMPAPVGFETKRKAEKKVSPQPKKEYGRQPSQPKREVKPKKKVKR